MDERLAFSRLLPVQLRALYAAAVTGLIVFVGLALLFPAPIRSYRSRVVLVQKAAVRGDEPVYLALLQQAKVEQHAEESFLAAAQEGEFSGSFADAVTCEVARPTPHCVEIVVETRHRYADLSLKLCQQIASDLLDRAEKSYVPGIDALRAQRSNVEQRLALVREAKRVAEDELTSLERDHLASFTTALEKTNARPDVPQGRLDPTAAEAERLETERQALIAKRVELARTRTDEHPQIKDLDERLAETERRRSALNSVLRTSSVKSPPAQQQLESLQIEFRRKSQDLGQAIAEARRREEDLLSEAARLAISPEPIPLFTTVSQPAEVVERQGGQPSGTQMLVLSTVSLAGSGLVYLLFRRVAATQTLASPEQIELQLGLPVLSLAASPSIPPMHWERMARRCVIGGELVLALIVVASLLLVSSQSQLAKNPAADPLGAVAESLDRTLSPTLRR